MVWLHAWLHAVRAEEQNGCVVAGEWDRARLEHGACEADQLGAESKHRQLEAGGVLVGNVGVQANELCLVGDLRDGVFQAVLEQDGLGVRCGASRQSRRCHPAPTSGE